MRSNNKVILASAGSGKTSSIVREAISEPTIRSALVTYTINANNEFRAVANEVAGFLPSHLYTSTWFRFLLRHFIRPYQREVFSRRVKGLHFVQGRSTVGIAERNTDRFYFNSWDLLYSDKASQLACKLIEKTGGKQISRLEKIYDRIYLDEVQDLAGYDLEILEHLLGSSIDITMVGDYRQATYKTNQSAKNRKYGRSNIVEKFNYWRSLGWVVLENQNHSYRCVQEICEFADSFFPGAEKTTSRNSRRTEHDGVFVISQSDVPDYVAFLKPQVLRYNKKTNVPFHPVFNFGQSKGMAFERVLIYPHGALLKFLRTGILKDAGKEVQKIYVAVTRARQSVAFVVPDGPGEYIVPFCNVALLIGREE